jgi:hypothetical protein
MKMHAQLSRDMPTDGQLSCHNLTQETDEDTRLEAQADNTLIHMQAKNAQLLTQETE